MINNAQIRYVHGKDEFVNSRGIYSGFTLCYSRFTDGVVFGYSMCNKRDTYTKAIGRDFALRRYHESVDLVYK